MDKLIGSNPRDELILAIESMKIEQTSLKEAKKARDKAEYLALAKEAEAERIKKRKQVCEHAFFTLAKKYLKLEGQFVLKLSGDNQKVLELEKIVFDKAKRGLWWKMPLVLIFGLGIPLVGWMALLSVLPKRNTDFPSYKFVSLYKWYKDSFGPIPLIQHYNLDD